MCGPNPLPYKRTGYKFLKVNMQPFKTYFSMYEHLFAESHLQGFKTGQQWNTLLEQCQIWNSANALVKSFELWKCVGENDDDDEMNTKSCLQMFEFLFEFFSGYNLFFQCCKTFFYKVLSFQTQTLTSLWNFFFQVWIMAGNWLHRCALLFASLAKPLVLSVACFQLV